MATRKTTAQKKTRRHPEPPLAGPRWPVSSLAIPILIAVIVIVSFSNSLHGQFVLDDKRNIEGDISIHSLLPTRASLLGPPWTTLTGRPVAMFSFALGYRIHGLAPLGYHLVNLVVHLLAGVVLFGVLRRTLLLPALQPRFRGREDILAGVIAAIWSCHPLTTASVTYLSQRAESLMGLFYLLTLYCVVRGAAGHSLWNVAAVVACLLGMGTKEPMVSAPLFVLLYDRTLLAGSFSQALHLRRWLYVGLGATWIPLAILLSMNPHGPDVALSFPSLSGLDYLKTQSKVIVDYLRLCFWPSPLILYYGVANVDVPILRKFPDYALYGCVILGLLGITVWGLLRRAPAALLGAWFFLILAPSSSIMAMPTEVIAEYRMYLPLISVIGLTVFTLDAALSRLGQATIPVRRAAVVLAAGLIIVLTIATRRRNEDFATPLTMWQDIVQKAPRNSVALANLGMFKYLSGQIDEAQTCFQRTLQLNPQSGAAHGGLGMVLKSRGRHDEAAAQFRLASEYAPRAPEPYLNLAVVLAEQGQFEQAVEVLTSAAQIIPADQDLAIMLGGMMIKAGREAEGRACLDRVVAADPDRAHAAHRSGKILLQLNLPRSAEAYFQNAADSSSRNPETYLSLGVLLGQQGQIPQAMEQYRRALGLAPDNLIALNNLAWYYATSPDPATRDKAKAAQYARRTVEIAGTGNAGALDTLAAAFAETGRFEEAASTAERALRLAEQDHDVALTDGIRQRLDLYRAGRPFRDQTLLPSTQPTTLP